MTDQPYPGPGPMPPQGPVPGQSAVPRPDMSFPHPVPTPYHRMLRTWTYEWWKPAVGILLVFVGFFVVTSMVYIVVAGVVAAFRSGSWLDNFMASADLSNVRPETLFALNLGLGSMILVTWFVMRVLHGLRPRWLTSVVPRMRWKFFAVCLGLAVIALAAQVAVGSVLPGDAAGGVGGKLNDFTTSTALAALVVLLTTPLQAAGEEYVFRGYLLQALGSLFSNRWVAIGATGLLFALAHGAQNFPLFFDRLSFGLIAAWLVIRTGGSRGRHRAARAEQLPGLRARPVLRRPLGDVERHRGELVEHRAHRHAVRRVRRPGALRRPPDGPPDAHPAAVHAARSGLDGHRRREPRDRLT